MDTHPTPTHQGHLQVTDQHQVYHACYGNPKGQPVLFVHGGPGGGTQPKDTDFFDLTQYWVVLVDQRGCGQSTPLGELTDNTTQALISDFEAIRQHLGITKWMLFGGSWGSTLSLAYAQAHPQTITHLFLRGIFLGRDRGTQWICREGGASRVWPEHWQTLVEACPELAHSEDPVQTLYQAVTQADMTQRQAACAAFARWEGAISKHQHSSAMAEAFATWPLSYSIARIELHYMVHGFFFAPDQLIHNLGRIAHIPMDIVHGRYDLICPIDDAFLLHQRMQALNTQRPPCLMVIDDAGHAASEPGIHVALQTLTQEALLN